MCVYFERYYLNLNSTFLNVGMLRKKKYVFNYKMDVSAFIWQIKYFLSSRHFPERISVRNEKLQHSFYFLGSGVLSGCQKLLSRKK